MICYSFFTRKALIIFLYLKNFYLSLFSFLPQNLRNFHSVTENFRNNTNSLFNPPVPYFVGIWKRFQKKKKNSLHFLSKIFPSRQQKNKKYSFSLNSPLHQRQWKWLNSRYRNLIILMRKTNFRTFKSKWCRNAFEARLVGI